MKRLGCGLFFLILIVLFSTPDAFPGQLTINSDEQFHYAVGLMEQGAYDLAVGELTRFIHFFPEDPKVPHARYNIGLAYLETDRMDLSRKTLEDLVRRRPGTAVAYRALLTIGESYYRQGRLEEATRYFGRVAKGATETATVDRALYRLGWTRLQADQWRDAAVLFGRVSSSSPLCEHARNLSSASLEGENLPRKDPSLAGLMAGILPGSGHVYCERYRDGVIAFLLNGLTIWAAVEAFDEDLEVLGGILTFIELGWYTGNIYSAVNASHKYNRKVRDDFRRNLTDRFSLGLLMSRRGHLGLTVSFRF